MEFPIQPRPTVKTSKPSSRIPFAVAALATIASATAHAEYRCATPGLLTLGEKRACDLARQDSPDALVRFVNGTKLIYGLYVYDYASGADAERWQMARQKVAPDQPVAANVRGATRGDVKSD